MPPICAVVGKFRRDSLKYEYRSSAHVLCAHGRGFPTTTPSLHLRNAAMKDFGVKVDALRREAPCAVAV